MLLQNGGEVSDGMGTALDKGSHPLSNPESLLSRDGLLQLQRSRIGKAELGGAVYLEVV